jgi:hypothetical protein
MGFGQGKELGDQPFVTYHPLVVAFTQMADDELVTAVSAIADSYAVSIIDSLPEEDPEILRNGLRNAFLAFFVDALFAYAGAPVTHE